jgi:hypothetical protein
LLWDHWGRCRIHWFPGSHIVHLDRGDYLRRMGRFLNEIEFNKDHRGARRASQRAARRAATVTQASDLEAARQRRAQRTRPRR